MPNDAPQKNMFTIAKVYEGIHKLYPNLTIENLGERDFIIDYEHPDKKEKSKGIGHKTFREVSVKPAKSRIDK